MNKIKKKVAVLGEAGVGKTTLIQMYCSQGQSFSRDYHMTQVCDIASKIIQIDDEVDVELFFFDVSGRDLYREPVSSLVRESDYVIMVYDLTRKSSVSSLSTWMDILKKSNNNRSLPGILIGTKQDLSVLREVSPENVKEMASNFEMESFELSCENFEQVEQAINTLARKAAE